MDLRSGNAYWLLKNGLLASYPTLKQNEQCDVAIIGGGITGALVARGMVGAGVDTIFDVRMDYWPLVRKKACASTTARP